MEDNTPETVFEVSWEVCNKVGGIYTVVKSKAEYMMEMYDGHYYLIGPYFMNKAAGEFSEEVAPAVLKPAFDALQKEGIICHFGKWIAGGGAHVILLDFAGFTVNTNKIKKELWDEFKIDSMGSAWHEYDEPIVWSYAAGKVIETITSTPGFGGRTVAQFHEWLAAGGLLYLKSKRTGDNESSSGNLSSGNTRTRVATVFTTHATILGRTMSSADMDLYSVMDKVEPMKEAYRLAIHTKYQTEFAAAQNADVFTTVSEITGMEAEKLLLRKPDVLLPNGLNIKNFPTFEEAEGKHKLYKNKILEFAISNFFPYYSFDIHNTIVFFLCGRYEFRDKGIDVYIEALGKLNEMLKTKKDFNKTIIAFCWVPAGVRGIKHTLLENRTLYNDLKESVDDDMDYIKTEVMHAVLAGKNLPMNDLFRRETLPELAMKRNRFMKNGTPSVCTHDLYDEGNDAIMKAFKAAGLNNQKEDKIKVVFYPVYLSGSDGLFDTNYYESMMGGNLGIFPSYYEPWGYTPLEGAALCTCSVTTDLAGFGRYIQDKVEFQIMPGVYVVRRLNRPYNDVVNEMTRIMLNFSMLDSEGRSTNRLAAKKLSMLADWKNLVVNYKTAHELAIKKAFAKEEKIIA